MGKTYDVEFKGEKVSAEISDDGKYFIKLPLRKNKDENEYYEYIVRDTLKPEVFGKEVPGWRFTSLKTDDENYNFNFWILDDGTMICNDSTNPQYRKLDKKFSRTAIPQTPSEELAKNVYSTFKQIFDLDRIGVPAKEVGKTRKLRLESALKLLGFDDTSKVIYPVEPGKSYYSLRRIGKMLEEYKNLAYVSREINDDGSEDFLVDYIDAPDAEKCIDGNNLTLREVRDDENYMQEYDEWIQTIREIPGVRDFLVDIRASKEKTEPNRLAGYMNIVRRSAQMLMGLNEDLIRPEDMDGIENLTTLQGIDLADKISELIDSESFEAACIFEDEWVIGECDRISSLIREIDGPIGVSAGLTTSLISIYRQIQMSRDERSKSVKKYNEIRKKFEGSKEEKSEKGFRYDQEEEEVK